MELFHVVALVWLVLLILLIIWSIRHPKPARGSDPHRYSRRVMGATVVPVLVALLALWSWLLVVR